MLIASETHRLAYRLIPKCASTTVLNFLLELHGIHGVAQPHKFIDQHQEQLRREAGIAVLLSRNREAKRQFIDERRDYFWFSVVRHPYSRIVSNYNNKLNRFALRFKPTAYYLGKLVQLTGGPAAWGDANHAARCMQRFVPFETFIEELGAHGVDFDAHYRPQFRLLTPEIISYQRLIRLEQLEEGLREIASSVESIARTRPVLPEVKELNTSTQEAGPAARSGCVLSDHAKQIVRRLYAQDFEFLGYPS